MKREEFSKAFEKDFESTHDHFQILMDKADQDLVFAGALLSTCCNCAALLAFKLCQGDMEQMADLLSKGINVSIDITRRVRESSEDQRE